MLRVQDVHVDRQGTPVLAGLSFDVAAGEVATLTGGNGCGKSTALLAIASRLPARAGRIGWISDATRGAAGNAANVGLLLQGGRVFQHLSVRENLEVAATRVAPSSEVAAKISKLRMKLPLLTRCWDRPTKSLSGGERHLVAFAMVLMNEPSLLLLDEPFAGVDAETSSAMLTRLLELKREGRTAILIVEHRTAMVGAITDRWLLLANGRVSETVVNDATLKMPDGQRQV